MRVLVVEDEADLGRIVQRTLQEEGYVCDWEPDGENALHRALTGPYDAILLDLMLPHVDGWTILQRLRAEGRTVPVLVLTARDTLPDKVCGLDLGADDYLTKPFELAELLARLRALIRRAAAKASPLVELGTIRIDTAARRVEREEQVVALTAKEYAVLELLAFRKGRVVSRSTIYDHVYGDDDDSFSNVLDVYVSNLRRKLGKDLIITRRGEGYLIP